MARQKSYNDIKRQVDRLQNSRFADRARRAGDKYLSNAYNRSYWRSKSYRSDYEGRSYGDYYGYDRDMKLPRSTYSGKSDAQFYAEELRKGKRIPKSAYKQSEAIRNGNASTVKDYLRKSNGDIRIGSPKSFWNHYIEGFSNVNGKLYANVYAQGDDTDTTGSVLIDDIERGRASISLTERFRNGNSQTLRFNITRNDLEDARKRLADTVREQEERQYAQRLIDKKAQGGLTGTERQRNNSSTASKGGVTG